MNDWLPLLQRLDRRLEQAIAAAQQAYGPEATTDPYRGLHVTEADVERLLVQEPGAPAFWDGGESTEFPPNLVPAGSRLAWLQQTFDLSDFDLDVVAIALAPELDRRYERLYMYLQDDVRGRRPTVDLALNLLCTDAPTRLTRRIHFAGEAPLRRHRLIHLVAEANPAKPTLLAHELHLDEAITRFLLAQPGLDDRLRPACQFILPGVVEQPLLKVASQPSLLSHIMAAQAPQRVYFHGPDPGEKRRTAVAIAHHLQAPLLRANLAQWSSSQDALITRLPDLFRAALLQQAVLFLEEVDSLSRPDFTLALQTLLDELAVFPHLAMLAGVQPWVPKADQPLGIVTIAFNLPTVEQRQLYWQHYLESAGFSIPAHQTQTLATRFRLTADQIAAAVALVPSPASPHGFTTLAAAARAQTGHALHGLARKIEPHYTWADLVLPADAKAQLQEICDQVTHCHQVQDIWGFGRKLALGSGLAVLFAGPPGTGKTMAAEVMAHELQLDLYKIDLSQVVSKYIGETEKNLNQIFTAAAQANAILLFDEADALFGKRSEVKDARDRYANIETSYLLQKMEEYDGIAILTTNLQNNMDEAFLRRLRFIVEFTPPQAEERRRIWQQIWPTKVPRSPDLDLDFLAEQLDIPGAAIRNIALKATYFAASDGGVVTMPHLIKAVRREYQKMGKLLMADDLGHYADLL